MACRCDGPLEAGTCRCLCHALTVRLWGAEVPCELVSHRPEGARDGRAVVRLLASVRAGEPESINKGRIFPVGTEVDVAAGRVLISTRWVGA